MGASDRWVLFSEVNGTVVKDGAPVHGADIVEKAVWSTDESKNYVRRAVTDKDGKFHFPALTRKKGFLYGWLPTQVMVNQTITIIYGGVEYDAWIHGKGDFEANTELDGKPLRFICDLNTRPEAVGTHYGICKPV